MAADRVECGFGRAIRSPSGICLDGGARGDKDDLALGLSQMRDSFFDLTVVLAPLFDRIGLGL